MTSGCRQALMKFADNVFQLEHLDGAFDLPPAAEEDEITSVAEGIGSCRRFDHRILAEARNERVRFVDRRAVMDQLVKMCPHARLFSAAGRWSKRGRGTAPQKTGAALLPRHMMLAGRYDFVLRTTVGMARVHMALGAHESLEN